MEDQSVAMKTGMKSQNGSIPTPSPKMLDPGPMESLAPSAVVDID